MAHSKLSVVLLALVFAGCPSSSNVDETVPCMSSSSLQTNCRVENDYDVTVMTADAYGQHSQTIGATTVLAYGIQGGFHMWLRIRAKALTPNNHESLKVVHRIHNASDNAVLSMGSRTFSRDRILTDSEVTETSAVPMLLCPPAQGKNVLDNPVVITVRLVTDTQPNIIVGEARAETRLTCPIDSMQSCVSMCGLK